MNEDWRKVIELLYGFFPAQVVRAVAELGIADQLADGPRTAAEVAEAIDAHGQSVHRLLRAAVQVELVTETADGRFDLAGPGQYLRTGVAGTMRDTARFFCGDPSWSAWGRLDHSVRTGQVALEHVFGMTGFEWLATRPHEEQLFNNSMAEWTAVITPDIVASYDWSRYGTLVDLGGGNGTLVSALVAAVPTLRGAVYDKENAGDGARAVFEAAGVTDRAEFIAGDFFSAVPEGKDAYVIKSVVHDWPDDDVRRILRNVRTAMHAGSELVIIEPLVPDTAADIGKVPMMMASDLEDMVITGGRERTESEFRALLESCDFKLAEVHRCTPPNALCMTRAIPA